MKGGEDIVSVVFLLRFLPFASVQEAVVFSVKFDLCIVFVELVELERFPHGEMS